MLKLKVVLLQWLIFAVVAATAIAFSVKISKGDNFFYNPLPQEILRNERMTIENLPFVVENFFIVGCINRTDKVNYKCKFALTGDEIIAVKENLTEIKSSLNECEKFFKENGYILPIDS